VRNPFKQEKKATDEDLISSIDDLTNEDKNEFNDTLNFIVSLSDDDYDKMLKCAKVYREADKKVSAIMETPAPLDGEKVDVRVVKSDDQKGKDESAKKTK